MGLVTMLILGLATWRLSSLLANEEGPFEMFVRLRHKLGVKYSNAPPYEAYGTNVVSKGIICVWCNSIWVGLVFTIATTVFPDADLLLLPFALSAMAVLIDGIQQNQYKEMRNG